MNERLKFRGWIKEVKEMCYDDEKNTTFTTKDMQSQQDDVIFMQSTGLRDKNGKLIFEGDIFKSTCHIKDVFYTIVWEDYGRWVYKDDKNKIIYQDISVFRNNEIIGNIYENPELLEQTKGEIR